MNKLGLYIGTSNFSSANHPKKHPNIQNIFSRSERKLSKSYFLNMYGHSKWSPHNFKLDPLDPFKFLEKVFAKALFSMQFLKNVILIFLDRSKCRAYSDLVLSIPMEFKKMQNKILRHMKILYEL